MDELLKTARENLEPPWDEVREARILARVLSAADDSREERPWWHGQRRRPAVWLAGAAAAAAIALAVIGGGLFSPDAAGPRNESASASPVASTSELTFAPGTSALLEPGAQVSTIEHSVERVELRQSSGRVAYRVNPDRHQVFEVRAEHVLVHVVGTRFTVEVGNDFVAVEVSKGEVSVVDGPRTLRLVAGENLRIVLDEEAALEDDADGDAPELAEPEAVESRDASGPPAAPSVDALMRRADAARQAGDWAAAAQALQQVAYQHAGDSRSVSALFSLGRVIRAQGDAARAADVFAQVRGRVGGGAMGEDALAEEAISRARAGQRARAASLAELYEAQYPEGPHLARVRQLR